MKEMMVDGFIKDHNKLKTWYRFDLLE